MKETDGIALRRADRLALDFGEVVIDVDLSRVDMTERQSAIVDKLVRETREIAVPECTEEGCPAERFLDPDEFEEVRQLKARLGPVGRGPEAAGPIIDFCLHVINV